MSILFFFTVIIVKLVYDRCQAARNIENDNRSDDSNDNNQAVTEVIQDDNSEEITNRRSAPSSTDEEKPDESNNSTALSSPTTTNNTTDLNVMLEYLQSLQNYKRLCAVVYLQRWYRKVLRKKRG